MYWLESAGFCPYCGITAVRQFCDVDAGGRRATGLVISLGSRFGLSAGIPQCALVPLTCGNAFVWIRRRPWVTLNQSAN